MTTEQTVRVFIDKRRLAIAQELESLYAMEREIFPPQKANWFDTLNQALESEGLRHLWPVGSNIVYGEIVSHNVMDRGHNRYISVFRNDHGQYERPIHYLT